MVWCGQWWHVVLHTHSRTCFPIIKRPISYLKCVLISGFGFNVSLTNSCHYVCMYLCFVCVNIEPRYSKVFKLRILQQWFKETSRMLELCFKFKNVSRMYQGCLKDASRMLQECYIDAPRLMRRSASSTQQYSSLLKIASRVLNRRWKAKNVQ